MDTKNEPTSLWRLMYGPWPKGKQRHSDLPGPLFDLTVIALAIAGAISYLVGNHTG
jgi:hypothetical protein